MTSLLERARQGPSKEPTKITSEHIDLCLAWVRDEISLTQVGAALQCIPSNSYVILARAMKRYLQQNPELLENNQ